MIDFHQLRHDPAHHLGLGDIRITIGQQLEFEQTAADLMAALELILPLAKGYAPKGQSATAKKTCREWIFFAEAAIAKARPQAGSAYLNRPLRSLEQAVRDGEGKS